MEQSNPSFPICQVDPCIVSAHGAVVRIKWNHAHKKLCTLLTNPQCMLVSSSALSPYRCPVLCFSGEPPGAEDSAMPAKSQELPSSFLTGQSPRPGLSLLTFGTSHWWACHHLSHGAPHVWGSWVRFKFMMGLSSGIPFFFWQNCQGLAELLWKDTIPRMFPFILVTFVKYTLLAGASQMNQPGPRPGGKHGEMPFIPPAESRTWKEQTNS